MEKFQRNRVYSLIVGTQEDAVEINNLQIRFRVTKTSSNKDKKNQASVEIFNLSPDRQKHLEDKYVTVMLKVGYGDSLSKGEDLLVLFSGQVVDVKVTDSDKAMGRTKRSDTDTVTTLTIDEFFKELNGRQVSKTIPAGKTVRDVVLGVVEDMPELTRYELNGEALKREVPDGYPLTGTPRQILDTLSKTYNLEWQIDQSVLYVSDIDGTFSDSTEGVPLVGEFSGLIERPEYKGENPRRLRLKGDEGNRRGKEDSKNSKQKKNTIHLRILLNPAITAGSIIKLEFEDLTGYYKVDEVTHVGDFRGNEWYSNLILSGKGV